VNFVELPNSFFWGINILNCSSWFSAGYPAYCGWFRRLFQCSCTISGEHCWWLHQYPCIAVLC
jgi:hypothetical protein